MTVRVVLADDEPLVRTGIAMVLSAEPDIEVVASVDDGEAAVAATERTTPDVVVLDVRMPGVGGVEATRRIVSGRRAAGSAGSPAVLALSTFNVDEAVYAALRAGAVGFLLKDTAPAELVHAVRALAAGKAWIDPSVAVFLVKEFAARREVAATVPDDLQLLTQREREILALVAFGLSNTEVASHLVIGEGTVKTHLGRIFGKLGLRSRAQAVVTAYRTGLVRSDDPPPPLRR